MNCLIPLILFCFQQAFSSRGDQSADYQSCVGKCHEMCRSENGPSISMIDRLFQWKCPDECRYLCMRQHVKQLRQSGGNQTLQYHGKWPFIRILGMQELFSVLFSVGNLLAQYRGYRKFRRALLVVSPKKYVFAPLVLIAFISNCNGWIWSSIFHARDFILTERLDYFSALWLVLCSLYFSVMRVFMISRQQLKCAIPMILYFAFHVCYMHYVKFDYSLNMIVTAGCGLLFNAIWILYYLVNKNDGKARHLRKAMIVGILFTLAGTLEITDFAPFFDLVDAHSLWHLATIPITKMWYDFLVDDVHYLTTYNRRLL